MNLMPMMQRWCLLTLFVLSNSLNASESKTFNGQDGELYLNWSSLVEEIEPVENPFLTLTQTDLEKMKDYASLKRRVDSNSSVYTQDELTEYHTQMESISKHLKAVGYDPEQLLNARNRIMQQQYEQLTSPNPNVLDKRWKMLGFIAPIEFDGTKATRFFLVPIAGACIHTPAPPPNQIVMVEFEQGIELKSLETPIWIEGKLESDLVTDMANYYDGQSQVDAIYTMKADTAGFYN